MKRIEQERLIARYLNGELSGAQEEEFFIQVAVDNDLRQQLKAFQIVDSALRKDRDAAPSQHPESRAHLLGLLGLSSSAGETSPAEPAVVGTASTGSFAGSLGSWIAASLGTAAVVVGGLLIGSSLNDNAETVAAASRQAGEAATVASTAMLDGLYDSIRKSPIEGGQRVDAFNAPAVTGPAPEEGGDAVAQQTEPPVALRNERVETVGGTSEPAALKRSTATSSTAVSSTAHHPSQDMVGVKDSSRKAFLASGSSAATVDTIPLSRRDTIKFRVKVPDFFNK